MSQKIIPVEEDEIIKGMVEVKATKEDIDILKKEILAIYKDLHRNLERNSFNHIIKGSEILQSKMVKKYSPEKFTEERVVRRLLRALGYSAEDIGSSEVIGIKNNTKKETDLSLKSEYKHKPQKILVEVEPLNKKWGYMKEGDISLPNTEFNYEKDMSGMEQVYMWLNYRDNGGKYGIATNGFVWQKARLVQKCNKRDEEKPCKEFIKFFNPIDLRDIFEKIEFDSGFSKISEKELERIDKKLKEFYHEFSKELIIYSFKGQIKPKKKDAEK